MDQAFPGGGELAGLMRATDWSSTPLGPVAGWSESLRTSVHICLGSRFPILIWWGPELTMLYNDAYRPILGHTKHPAALGQAGHRCWPEIWDVIGPMLGSVMEDGVATWSDDQLLELDRNGFLEECYFTFSYSPIMDGGRVGGVFTAVTETTARVVGERRLRTLSDLGAVPVVGGDVEDVSRRAVAALAADEPDVPFAVLHGEIPGLEGAGPIAAVGPVPPLTPEVTAPLAPGAPMRLLDLPASGARGAGRRAPVAVVPLDVGDDASARLTLGLSMRRPFDDDYRDFVALVARQVSGLVSEARALDQERRRAEALEQLDRAKTVFFSDISHELRTPLTLILGPVTDRLRSDPRDRKMAVVRRNALRLRHLVDTLLDMSRLDAGRMTATYRPVDLGPFTADVASVMRSGIEAAGLRLEIDCPALGEPAFVDPALWERVVINLLSNALKFTFEGSIRVALAAEGGSAVLRVDDTGVGIPPDQLERVFERFHRVEGAGRRVAEGSGIGLSMVRDIAELHGGRAWAEPRARGARLVVALPLGDRHLPADRIGPAAPTAPTYAAELEAAGVEPLADAGGREEVRPAEDGDGRRILLADDNADMRRYLTALLGRLGPVEAVADGAEALAAALADPPGVVVADVMMPGLDGMELVRRLRADPRTASVPIVFLSARAGPEAAAAGIETGADDYLVKPFSAEELLARVGSQIQLARERGRTESLRRLAEALAGAGGVEEIAACALSEAAPALESPLGVALGYLDSAGESLFVVTQGELPAVPGGDPRWRVGDATAMCEAVRRGRVVTVGTRGEWEERYPQAARLFPDTGSGFAVPVRSSGRTIGALAVMYAEEHAFGRRDVELIESMAPQVGQALERARLQEAERRALAAQLSALRDRDEQRRMRRLAEHQVSLAVSAAPVGVYSWDIARDSMTGDAFIADVFGLDERELAAGVPIERVLCRILDEDRPGVERAIEGAIQDRGDYSADFRVLDSSGALRWVMGRGRIEWDGDDPAFLAGVGIDVTADRRALEAEHETALRLQRSMLPAGLESVPGMRVVGRYEAAADRMEVGGDWYDSVALPDGRLGVCVGDVVGHSVEAATVMGQLRNAVAVEAPACDGPAALVHRVERFARRVDGARYTTLCYADLDPTTGALRYCCAGHPPPLLVRPGGAAEFLDGGRSAPLLATRRRPREQAGRRIEPGSMLLLYSDGLIERRGECIDTGLERLRRVASARAGDAADGLAGLVDGIVADMTGDAGRRDDIAVLCVAFDRVTPTTMTRRLPARPDQLRVVRRAIRDWVAEVGLGDDLADDLLLVCGEACANAIEHAYRDGDGGEIEVSLGARDGSVEATVRDFGRWRPEAPGRERGRGLSIISRLADDCDVLCDEEGTTLVMSLTTTGRDDR